MKLSGVGLAGLFAPPLNFHFDDPFACQQGRVVTRTVWILDSPTVKANPVRICHRDMLLNITNTAISDDESSHNRVWYEIDKTGYVYSGNIQPVRTILNTPNLGYSQGWTARRSQLCHLQMHMNCLIRHPTVAYRMYYETTHWVKSVTTAADGQVWYQVRDDKWDKLYYARAEHIRILTADELAPISPEIPNVNKKIQVRLGEQLVIALKIICLSLYPRLQQAAYYALEHTPHPKVSLPPITNALRATCRQEILHPTASTCPVYRGCNT